MRKAFHKASRKILLIEFTVLHSTLQGRQDLGPLPEAQALSVGCSGVMGGAVPKAGGAGVGVKTGGASPGGAASEDRLAMAEKTAADQGAAGQVVVVPGWLVDLQGQHQDNHLVSCARPAPAVLRTCP